MGEQFDFDAQMGLTIEQMDNGDSPFEAEPDPCEPDGAFHGVYLEPSVMAVISSDGQYVGTSVDAECDGCDGVWVVDFPLRPMNARGPWKFVGLAVLRDC